MTGAGLHRFSFATSSPISRVDRLGRRLISTDNLHADQRHIRDLTSPFQPREWAWDLLTFVRAAFLADKAALRRHSRDRWTRTIELSVPVVTPELWDEETRGIATALLSTLTGDRWILEIRKGEQIPPSGRAPLNGTDIPADNVVLFSGGLDSTAAAAHLAAEGRRLLLVTYSRGQLGALQDRVAEDIARLGGHMQPAVRVTQDPRGLGETELTSRSRGLLYAATAIYLAAAHGRPTVTMAENGQLAINLPLTERRLTACSTRSVHPRTLDLLNRLVARLGGTVTVANPFLYLTKGDVCRVALGAGLHPDALYRTISCGRPPMYRSSSALAHCGLCVACLFRRSGLLAALGSDQTPYGSDPIDVIEDGRKSADYRALMQWLDKPFTTASLIRDLPLPAHTPIAQLESIIERGREELLSMVNTLTPHTTPTPEAARELQPHHG